MMLTKGLYVPCPTITPSTWQRATTVYRSAAKGQVYVKFWGNFHVNLVKHLRFCR